jgi:hypothetical protein
MLAYITACLNGQIGIVLRDNIDVIEQELIIGHKLCSRTREQQQCAYQNRY